MRVLVADGDLTHRAALVAHLQPFGHALQEVGSSKEFLEICKSKCPDLILVDWLFEGQSCLPLVNQLRQLGGSAVWVPVVLMKSEFTDAEIEQSLEANADDFLLKPVEAIRLKIKVRSAERLKNLKDEVFTVAHDLVLANRALETMVTQDVLTGIGTANSFEDALEKEWFKAKRTSTPLALIMTDIDYFVSFNKTYGAEEGDKCIKRISDALRTAIPATEGTSLSRISGATFAYIIPNTDRSTALQWGEKLRLVVDNLKIPHTASGCSDHVTISSGIALAEPEHYTSPWDLKEGADFALYQAKHYGRNRSYAEPAGSTAKT
jgi:diguanylate cyclase (GGDEF)-like protein